ncbi:MAG TPA: BON domain-containing protein [Chloroflexota bacterium]|nr:BON domain-containing protein [Chloroflexota bacterium]
MAVTYTDSEIRQNVWDEISHDVRIDPSDIRVTVTDGIVYLNGTVPTYSQRITAAEDARRVKGVIDVVNNLAVRLTRVWTDEEIRDTIRGNLDRDVRITDPFKIHIAVSGGIVTLSGTVPNHGQKTAAEDDAWAAPGVIDVINNIVVTPPTKRSDAEIEADVRRALDTDPNINAARITVSVVDGVVYLRGSVPTYYQIDEASDDAWRVPGVVDVVNELTVS